MAPEPDGLFPLDDVPPAAHGGGGASFRDSPAAARLLDVRTVYAEPEAAASPRGREILARFPDAVVVEVPSHWRIPGLHGNEGNAARWVRVKTRTLVLGVKKTLTVRPNGRSADWIAPGASNGCALACAYCYVPRRKGYANPVTTFTNIDRVIGRIARHVAGQGRKPAPNQCDPRAWVYDIGENGDCSVDALISDNTADLVSAFRQWPTAKASFATKFVNPDLLRLDPGDARGLLADAARGLPAAGRPHQPGGRTDRRRGRLPGGRVRGAPQPVAGRRTPRLAGRVGGAVPAPGRRPPAAVKAQAAAEVIMLTHNAGLHGVNLGWHPRAEELLWRPALQEPKRSQNGDLNMRYRAAEKAASVRRLLALAAEHAPWLRIRHAF